MDHGRPRGIIVVALLMIVFGCAEVVTALTHNFFGLHITPGNHQRMSAPPWVFFMPRPVFSFFQ
jgi:hypothetical protein